ncbi:MAG: T9SS type A sorting domain-containing protein [bacterium]
MCHKCRCITLPQSNNISLKIYTIDGRLIKVIDAGYRNEGIHTINYPFKELSTGIYLIFLENGKMDLNRAFIIVR